MGQTNQSVSLTTLKLKEIFDLNVIIPEYQRIYCWKEKHVYQLWQDILTLEDGKPYHLGTIIFHKKEDNYEIVDGQQRLITLTLIVQELNNASYQNSLLSQKLTSHEAEKYVAYNRFIINNYIDGISEEKKKSLLVRILTNIQFAVLKIYSDTLDLAYTFFSSQNSKGKSLSDYNLLKAHHLRFVTIQEQAIHVATRWDMLTNSNDETDNSEADLERTLGVYLFRLRKWMRKRDWNENSEHRVKAEFEKAMTIAKITSFGEQFYFYEFYFYEKMQGGTHFFAYAEYFVHQFKIFKTTPQAKALRDNLRWESHWYYKDCIETFLFAYYLKFGTMYLTDALVCIEKVVSWHRYSVNRAMLYRILEHARSSEIIMIIDQSTSPTFFLAEMLHKINTALTTKTDTPIKNRYNNCTQQVYKQIGIEKINVDEIKELINGK